MSGKRVVPRERANRDVEAAVDHCLGEGGERLALGLVDALAQGYDHIARHPDAGSLRQAYELDLPAVRCRPLRRHPYLVFYVERDDHIDVWRVLHGRRDIPSSIHEGDDP